MEIYGAVLITFGIIFLIIAVIVSNNGCVFSLTLIGVILLLVSSGITGKAGTGKPAPSLNVLTNGEKYEVVDIYEKYIIIKSATDNGKLKFVGPLDFGTRTIATGRYVKTAEESLEKIE